MEPFSTSKSALSFFTYPFFHTKGISLTNFPESNVIDQPVIWQVDVLPIIARIEAGGGGGGAIFNDI